MYEFLLAMLVLLSIGGFVIARRLDKAVVELLGHDTRLRQLETDLTAASVALDSELRRSHVRLDNHQRQLEAIGKDIGWVDDKRLTKVLSGVIPKE